MRVWDYLRERMEEHAERPALGDGRTYRELIRIVEDGAARYPAKNRLIPVTGGREEQALNTLSVLASGNAAVPLDPCYGEDRFREILRRVEADGAEYPDLAFVMFTSGTGGRPKGVMLTQDGIIANLKMIGTYFDIGEGDRLLIARPLVHIAVLTGELLYGLSRGATLTFYEEAFQPLRMLGFIRERGITVLCATPTLFAALGLVNRSRALPLRTCSVSGERLTAAACAALEEGFPGVRFYHVYGLTEHSPRVSALLPEDFSRRAGSVGRPLAGVELKIEEGELLVRSPCVMKGYYRQDERTAQKLRDGWLRTGDMAACDAEGFFYILGRRDGMIIRCGLNICPEEIEARALEIPGVTDCLVREETVGADRRIKLRYVGTHSAAFCRRALASRLDAHLMPDEVERVEELPMTGSGKRRRS